MKKEWDILNIVSIRYRYIAKLPKFFVNWFLTFFDYVIGVRI